MLRVAPLLVHRRMRGRGVVDRIVGRSARAGRIGYSWCSPDRVHADVGRVAAHARQRMIGFFRPNDNVARQVRHSRTQHDRAVRLDDVRVREVQAFRERHHGTGDRRDGHTRLAPAYVFWWSGPSSCVFVSGINNSSPGFQFAGTAASVTVVAPAVKSPTASAHGVFVVPTRVCRPKFRSPLPHWNGSRVVSMATSRTISSTRRLAGIGSVACRNAKSPPGNTKKCVNVTLVSFVRSQRSVPATSM